MKLTLPPLPNHSLPSLQSHSFNRRYLKMSFTLHTDAGNFRAFKILIAAEYAGVAVEVPDFKIGTDNQTAEFLAKSPLGRVPVLDTPQGSLFESNAIARYVARLRPDVGLMGANFQESAQVRSLALCASLRPR